MPGTRAGAVLMLPILLQHVWLKYEIFSASVWHWSSPNTVQSKEIQAWSEVHGEEGLHGDDAGNKYKSYNLSETLN